MFTRTLFCATLSIALLVGLSNSADAQRSQGPNLDKTHYGGCIMLNRTREAPDDLFMNSGVVPTDEYPPFTKKIDVYGYTLVGRDDISDKFMIGVAKTIVETLPQGKNIDNEHQESFIRDMYEHRALIPFYKGTSRIEDGDDRTKWSETRTKNSVCDVIMEAPGDGQVMEVVEHILHYANDVGLHYTFPKEWGMTRDSELFKFMIECNAKNYYNRDSDKGIEDEDDDRNVRGPMQEFGYWVITTAWNLQEPYGPHIGEWTIKDAADMKEKMPEMLEMVERTIGKIMKSPSIATLEEFNE